MSENSTSNNNDDDASISNSSEKPPLKQFPKLHDYPYAVGTPVAPTPPAETPTTTVPTSAIPSDNPYDDIQDAPQRPPAAMPVGAGVGVVNIILALFLAPGGFIVSIATLIINRRRKGIGKTLTWVALIISIPVMIFSSLLGIGALLFGGTSTNFDSTDIQNVSVSPEEATAEIKQVLQISEQYYLGRDFTVNVSSYQGFDAENAKNEVWVYFAEHPENILIIEEDKEGNIISSNMVPIDSVDLFATKAIDADYELANKYFSDISYLTEDNATSTIALYLNGSTSATQIGDVTDYSVSYYADANNEPLYITYVNEAIKSGDEFMDIDTTYKYYNLYTSQKYVDEYEKVSSTYVKLVS